MELSGGKRRSENGQLRKEEYEESVSTPDDPGVFKRASADVLARRRTISVSDRFKTKQKEGLFATPQKNPFASVVLKPAEPAPPPLPLPASTQKIAKCNKALANWLRYQHQHNNHLPWTQGLKDYVKHVKSLQEKTQPKQPFFQQQKQQQIVAGEDEDAAPPEPPSELGRAADQGDEREIFEARAGIRRLDHDDNNAPVWKDLGKGTLRISEHLTSTEKHAVVRNDAGKVVLNFKIVPTMKFFQGKSGIKFTAVVESGVHNYLLRTKPPVQPEHLKPASVVSS